MSEINLPDLRDKYPPNNGSNAEPNISKKTDQEPRKFKKVVSGKVTVQPKPLHKRILSALFDDDGVDLKGYLYNEVIVPYFKEIIWTGITGGLGMLLYKDFDYSPRSKKSYGPGKETTINYAGISKQTKAPPVRGYGSNSKVLDNLEFSSNREAVEVLDILREAIDKYGTVSVSQLYDLVGVTGTYTDDYLGWDDLSRASIIRSRGVWILDLPRAINIAQL